MSRRESRCQFLRTTKAISNLRNVTVKPSSLVVFSKAIRPGDEEIVVYNGLQFLDISVGCLDLLAEKNFIEKLSNCSTLTKIIINVNKLHRELGRVIGYGPVTSSLTFLMIKPLGSEEGTFNLDRDLLWLGNALKTNRTLETLKLDMLFTIVPSVFTGQNVLKLMSAIQTCSQLQEFSFESKFRLSTIETYLLGRYLGTSSSDARALKYLTVTKKSLVRAVHKYFLSGVEKSEHLLRYDGFHLFNKTELEESEGHYLFNLVEHKF